MKDDRFFALLIVGCIILFFLLVGIMIVHSNNLHLKEKCIESNKTYLELSEKTSVISIHYCGDIAEIKDLIDQARGSK